MLSQRDERFFGSGITSFNAFFNLIAASAMNLVWKGTPAASKICAKMPSLINCSINLVTGPAFPDTYTLIELKIGSTVIVGSYFYTGFTYDNSFRAKVGNDENVLRHAFARFFPR